MLTRVDPRHAGPNAIGILIPPGTKTLVIVRPRALEWDLLPARWSGQSDQPPQFCTFTRDDAAGVARRLVDALDASIAAGVSPVQTFGNADAGHLQLWVRTDEFVWIVCKRVQGVPYQPMIFASLADVAHAGEMLAGVVWPAASETQEYYFNTQSFSH